MMAGCYTLDLYCENADVWPDPLHAYNEFPRTYIHELGSVCRSNARRDGWLIGDGDHQLCPRCSGKVND